MKSHRSFSHALNVHVRKISLSTCRMLITHVQAGNARQDGGDESARRPDPGKPLVVALIAGVAMLSGMCHGLPTITCRILTPVVNHSGLCLEDAPSSLNKHQVTNQPYAERSGP